MTGLISLLLWLTAGAWAQLPQNPSPQVEHTREHPRRKEEQPRGRRDGLSLGVLFQPPILKNRRAIPLLVHFHGPPWIAELAAVNNAPMAALTFELGQGSAVYARPFEDPARFGPLLKEAEEKLGVPATPLTLSSWSAGYGAIRAILRQPEYFRRVDRVLLIDSLHAGYAGGKPGPLESTLVEEDLAVFVEFAREAVAGRKQMIVTHSEIFPGTYASTTETADDLLRQLGLRRRAVLKWGPMKTQQLGEASQGSFVVLSYAGNSAPDHVDQLNALPELLRLFKK